MTYNYPYLEKFYQDNFSELLSWNSSLRPSKSCPKNGAAGIIKFQEFYKKSGVHTFTEKEVLKILNAENVEDGDTIFHQNLRVMRELNFLLPIGDKKYKFTDDFLSFVESGHTVDCYIIEKLMSIASIDDLTMYFNFLICVMREAANYGQVIQYGDSALKFEAAVPDDEKRKEHQQRVYSIYGFKGDEARNVPENYTPNISYFCHAVLKQLGILAKSDKKVDNMRTLELTPLGELILKKIDENLQYGKEKFENQINKIKTPNNEPLQQIFYGAPGTGKSHKIKDDANVKIADAKNLVFRTTFHPDSDYSTFVGCYKPTKEPSLQKQPILDYDSLVDKLKEYLATEPVNITRSCALFGCDYHDSIVKMQESGGHTIPNLVADAYKSGTTYDSTVRAGMNIYESGTKTQGTSSSITYTFVPQAFLQAYVAAWNNPDENVYLVIEEINRGNCAQIFGDLFQLLDRDDNGESEYPIMADRDLAKYLLNEKDENNVDVLTNKEGIKDGKLKLPKNLYIWATMNTSDQSLFPIDSAFKRRWDWVYIPIKDHEEKDFKIDINGTIYSWWGFLEKINNVIGQVTSSEDKKLGYFFVKANGKDIDATKFVGKVLFYLWNDVFKNYGFENAIFSKGENKIFTFSDFFDKNGDPNTEEVNNFLKKLDETIDKDNSFIIQKSKDSVSSEEESSDEDNEQQEG